MKLIIQIPCFNEEVSLPLTLASLPRTAVGFDAVEWLVIDDGSSDRTAEVAVELGVDHLVRFSGNRGLSAAFMAGIAASLACGADVIINTDADNQYNAADIPLLLEPILAGKAGFVIGLRPVYEAGGIPLLIKFLHMAGSMVVMLASGTRVSDPPSGFRAFTRETAARLAVHNSYTYTLETIIQAGNCGIPIELVKIRINSEKLRPSRLMSSPYSYVLKSTVIILKSLMFYNPCRFFALIYLPLLLLFLLAAAGVFFFGPTLLSFTALISSLVLLAAVTWLTSPVLLRRAEYSAAGRGSNGT